MKSIKLFLVLAFAISTNVFAVKKPTVLNVDASKSGVKWLAKKVGGQHDGTVGITKGTLEVEGGKLVGGNFVIDMTTMKCTDITDAGYNAKLMGHLSGSDFFDTAKFGTANLKITKVVTKGSLVEITGDLTIKGITAPITFPAVFASTPTGATASAGIIIDRTKYDIKYNSKSFFASIGDKAIDDNFTLTISLVAAK